MKKIALATLLVSFAASSNAGVKNHLSNNWKGYTSATVALAAVGGALYYDYKCNESANINKVKEFVKANPKAAAGIIAAVTAGTAGVGYGIHKDAHKAAWNKTKGAAGWTKDHTYGKVKGWFSKKENDDKEPGEENVEKPAEEKEEDK
ncbi:hypothetical protein GF385_02205 [Candidatus Dependentiae bacterium]|nr:hypothetical protein [Candidatus Dependentiae bacterium]